MLSCIFKLGYTYMNIESDVYNIFIDSGESLVTMESLTAGLIASTVANMPGSSAYLDGGFVVYTPEMKISLGVNATTIKKYSVVSIQVAKEMAMAALIKSPKSTVAISVTGVAGPSGGTLDTPVGTVCWAVCYNNPAKNIDELIHGQELFSGSRNEIRQQTVDFVLKKAILLISSLRPRPVDKLKY